MKGVRSPGTIAVAWLASLTWAGPEHPARPVTMAVVVDASGSLEGSDLDATRRLTLGVLEHLPPRSELAVFAFADQSRLVLPRSAYPDAVRQALAALEISGRRTALHDALYDATRYLRDAPTGRKAILLLTDGRDEGSVLALEDGLRLAEDLAIPIFAVGMGDRVEERVLRRIAKLTEGEYLPARRAGPERLAARILAQTAGPPVEPAARGGEAPALPRSPAASGPKAAEADPAVPASPARALGRLWRLLALGALAVLGLAAIRALRRRAPARCPRCGRERLPGEDTCGHCPPGTDERPTERPSLASATLLARLSSTEEYLDRTMVLREDHLLAVTHGPEMGARYALSAASALSLGRSKANDVVLEDPSVSSQHCRIRPTPDGGFMVHDLKSTNGTYVNERRVTQHALAEGDVIRVGETRLQYRRDQGQAN